MRKNEKYNFLYMFIDLNDEKISRLIGQRFVFRVNELVKKSVPRSSPAGWAGKTSERCLASSQPT